MEFLFQKHFFLRILVRMTSLLMMRGGIIMQYIISGAIKRSSVFVNNIF